MYCSIQEAFQSTIPDTSSANRQHKRSKRNRASPEPFQTALGPSPSQGPSATDPDRPANIPLPPAEYVGGGAAKPSYSNMLAALDSNDSYFPNPVDDSDIKDVYNLEPNWASQFDGPSVPPWIKDRIASREAEIPLKPVAPGPASNISSWMEGTMPTLWQKVPGAYSMAPAPAPVSYSVSKDEYDRLERKLDSKLDRMFAKLEELESGKSESCHIEIILFILGGLFLLLMLDMLVKQGTKATMLIAAAGGGGLGSSLRSMRGLGLL
jgi:hypothetical protein